jgi:hypothetical protein
VTSGLQLQWVVVVREVGLLEPPGRRSAVTLCQQAGPSGDPAFEDLQPDADDPTKELKKVQRDPFTTTNSTVGRRLKWPSPAADSTESTQPVLRRVEPKNVGWGPEGDEVEADALVGDLKEAQPKPQVSEHLWWKPHLPSPLRGHEQPSKPAHEMASITPKHSHSLKLN